MSDPDPFFHETDPDQNEMDQQHWKIPKVFLKIFQAIFCLAQFLCQQRVFILEEEKSLGSWIRNIAYFIIYSSLVMFFL